MSANPPHWAGVNSQVIEALSIDGLQRVIVGGLASVVKIIEHLDESNNVVGVDVTNGYGTYSVQGDFDEWVTLMGW